MAGAPPLLTTELAKAICTHVERGNSTTAAAMAEGISLSSVMRWQERGRKLRRDIDAGTQDADALTDNEVLYLDFADRLTLARGKAITTLKAGILKAGIEKQDWRALEALGKMMYPDEFRTQVEITGPEGGPIQFAPDLSKLEALIAESHRALLNQSADIIDVEHSSDDPSDE